jgi:hypothetical protein
MRKKKGREENDWTRWLPNKREGGGRQGNPDPILK